MALRSDEVSTAVTECIQLLERGLRIETVILYGSCSRNEQHDGSDIDIAVVSPDFEGMPAGLRQVELAKLLLKANPWISAIGYPSSSYHNPGSHSFLGEIIRTGRVVYQAPQAA